MHTILKIKRLSIWIFFIPFISINTCLILSQIFPFGEGPFAIGDPIGETGGDWIIPYIDGIASISRVTRVYPNNLIFKPCMILTAILLFQYWYYNKKIISKFDSGNKHAKIMFFYGFASAICLILHSIFLGIKFDINIYKLFRRIILLSFIIFELIAQAYLITILFKIKHKVDKHINKKILFFKRILVSSLIVIAIISLPFLPYDNFKYLKHGLEWNFFLGVIGFYYLTFLMWKSKR